MVSLSSLLFHFPYFCYQLSILKLNTAENKISSLEAEVGSLKSNENSNNYFSSIIINQVESSKTKSEFSK